MRPKIHPKVIRIQAWTPRCPFLCSQVPMVPNNRSRAAKLSLQEDVTRNTFKQMNSLNNYLLPDNNNFSKGCYFGPTTCWSNSSCQSKSASKPTTEPTKKPILMDITYLMTGGLIKMIAIIRRRASRFRDFPVLGLGQKNRSRQRHLRKSHGDRFIFYG